MRVKGITQEQSIKLLQNINIPHGTEVFIDIVEINKMSSEDKLKEFYTIINNWECKDDYIEIMENLENERQGIWEKENLLLTD